MRTRRQFFQACGALGLSSALVSDRAVAQIPERDGQPLMKLSLAAYSFNRLFARRGTPERIAAARLNLEAFIDYCASLQLGGTELTGYYFPKNITHEYLLQLRRRTHVLGLDISATAIGNNFCLPEGEARQRQLQECRDWIDYAAVMGAPAIRIFAGQVPKGGDESEAMDRCVQGIRESLEYASKKGVFLALENHHGITSTPDQILGIMERVEDHTWFGINFDSGNFRTDDPYRDLARIAPYAINAQIKTTIHPHGGGKQPADLSRIMGILKDAGYRGYVSLEYEEKDPYEEIPKYLDQLRSLI